MILTRGKIIIIAIFVAIVAGLFGMIAFTDLEAERFGPQIEISVADVSLKEFDKEENKMMIEVDFVVFNKAKKTLTLSKIDYNLYANEKFLGTGYYSLENAPLVGRAPLFPDSSTTLQSTFNLRYSDDLKDVWNLLASNTENNSIAWRAKGVAEIESAFSIIPVSFESSI
ncbi:MAG: hypothetical protein ACE5J2_08275 [Nitrososphaerales archaeon]